MRRAPYRCDEIGADVSGCRRCASPNRSPRAHASRWSAPHVVGPISPAAGRRAPLPAPGSRELAVLLLRVRAAGAAGRRASATATARACRGCARPALRGRRPRPADPDGTGRGRRGGGRRALVMRAGLLPAGLDAPRRGQSARAAVGGEPAPSVPLRRWQPSAHPSLCMGASAARWLEGLSEKRVAELYSVARLRRRAHAGASVPRPRRDRPARRRLLGTARRVAVGGVPRRQPAGGLVDDPGRVVLARRVPRPRARVGPEAGAGRRPASGGRLAFSRSAGSSRSAFRLLAGPPAALHHSATAGGRRRVTVSSMIMLIAVGVLIVAGLLAVHWAGATRHSRDAAARHGPPA